MKILLAILLLLFPLPLAAGEPIQLALTTGVKAAVGSVAAAASCSTSTDSDLVTGTSGTVQAPGNYVAIKVVLGAETTATEYVVTLAASYATGGNPVTFSLRTDSSGSPNSSDIADTSVSREATGFSSSCTAETFTLATPKSGLSAGTYWLVRYNNSANTDVRPCTGAHTGTWTCTSSNGSTWDCSGYSGYEANFTFRGCQP